MVFGVQVPDTPDCPRHVLLRRLGGGAQFCDRGATVWSFSPVGFFLGNFTRDDSHKLGL